MKPTKEMEAKLTIAAETCLAHIKHLEMKQNDGEEIHPEDYGILALERCFLVLYSYHIKGEIPDFASELFEETTVN